MGLDDVTPLILLMRRLGGEPTDIEVKRAAGGLPRSVRETLSAFSNSNGGMLLLGVDEDTGFTVIDLDNPTALRDALVQMSRDDMTPPLQITAEIAEAEGQLVVVAEVPAVSSDQKPVYVTNQGIANGSYIRSGDGDRRMSQAEIALVMANRGQPLYDREPIEGTSIRDLDDDLLRRTLRRVRNAGHTRIAQAPDEVLLARLGVTAAAADAAPLTLAGLLTFGEFPQQFFPQLMVSFVAHSPDTARGTRLLDNQTIRGPIPDMVESALAVVQRNLAVRAIISDRGGRNDELEYPIEAVREAIVNALLHRDYSPTSRGTQVQIDLFPDRLVIRSPGGLYGGVVEDALGEEGVSSSRNATLASLLSDTYLPSSSDLVAENRASGIPAMIDATRRRGLPLPRFKDTITAFTVSMDRSALLSAETQAWIDALRADLPTPTHRIAVAMLRDGHITNEMLRQQWGVDRVIAGHVLRDLVEQGIAVKEGGRRYARYVLSPSPGKPEHDPFRLLDAPPSVAESLRTRGTASAAELAGDTGLSRTAVLKHLNRLIKERAAEAVGPSRSPRRTYRWITPSR